jgi:hypothetical protein
VPLRLHLTAVRPLPGPLTSSVRPSSAARSLGRSAAAGADLAHQARPQLVQLGQNRVDRLDRSAARAVPRPGPLPRPSRTLSEGQLAEPVTQAGHRAPVTAATSRRGTSRGTPVQDCARPHVYLYVCLCRPLIWANTVCRPLACGIARGYERTLNPLP